jgi:prepilin-type N-terminal cleavage/methylation domain-containing protein
MKPSFASRRQRGFTLVEIAIVLMIIGLLIGGILRGQELIQSARVRNIIDQKSAIQTAYIGFLDRYRMLPGDLTPEQAGIVGNAAQAGKIGTPGSGDGIITIDNESTLFFQNLTASGFLSCGTCMSVVVVSDAAGPASSITNSPINVYGTALSIGHVASNIAVTATSTLDWFNSGAVTRLVVATGTGIPSQVLAEVDRKADDGWPGTGQLRFAASGTATLALCATGLSAATLTTTAWVNPTRANCQGAWLL